MWGHLSLGGCLLLLVVAGSGPPVLDQAPVLAERADTGVILRRPNLRVYATSRSHHRLPCAHRLL